MIPAGERFDTHAHLDDARLDADRDAVMARATAAGVSGGLVPGLCASQWPRARAVARAYGWRHAVGTHPAWLGEALAAGAPLVPAKAGDAAAIGECGLDARIDVPMSAQVAALHAHLARAGETGLPLVLHCVGAHEVLLAELRAHGPVRGVLHAYSGGVARVDAYLRVGLHLSFGGAITWEGARRPVEALRATPRERLLAESDAPDQAPRPHRGRCEPAHLREVITAMEQLRGETLTSVLRANAASLGW